jgi:predicted DNA-binding transcriptional regulator AlpA
MSTVEAVPAPPLSQADLAKLFGVSSATIVNWTRDGRLPPPIRIGRRPYWTARSIARLLEQGEVAETSA